MPTAIDFGSRAEANTYRDEHPEHVHEDDDRRFTEVTFADDAPAWLVDQDELDFRRTSVPEARAVKAIELDEGVDDWLAHFDHDLSVDEHREVMADAATEGGGRRLDNEESVTEKAGRAARKVQSQQCDRAEDHCEDHDPEACEFLQNVCGYTEDEVSRFLDERPATDQQNLVTVGGGDYPAMEVSPEVAGALSRAWQGYKGAVSRLDRELTDVREAVVNARQSMAAINAIRERHDQDELHPDRLHDLLEALGSMPADIPDIRTLDHYQEVSQVDRDDVIERVAFALGTRCRLRSDEVVRVAPEHVADTDAGTMLRVWRSAKTDKYRETPIPSDMATTIRTVGEVRDEPADEPLVDKTTRTLRRWIKRAAEELREETGEPGWKYVGFHDLRRTWATSLRSADVDAMVVCDWGGWDDLDTFLDHYKGTHSPESQLRERKKVGWL